jgi:hypothetical protein
MANKRTILWVCVLMWSCVVFGDLEPELRVKRVEVTERTNLWIEQKGLRSVLNVYTDELPVWREAAALFFPLEAGGSYRGDWDQLELKDYNADGRMDFAFGSWSGGAHCCRTLYVMTLDPEPELLVRLELSDSQLYPLEDLDADGRYDLEIKDSTFTYWKASFAGSPMPRVVLSLGKEGFEVNLRMMRRTAAEVEQIMDGADSVRRLPGDGTGTPDSRYWANILELVYGGHPEWAAVLAKEAWPYGEEALLKFLEDFKTEYKRSPWYSDLQALWAIFEEDIFNPKKRKEK